MTVGIGMIYGNTYFDSPRVPLKRYSRQAVNLQLQLPPRTLCSFLHAGQASNFDGGDVVRSEMMRALYTEVQGGHHQAQRSRQANERSS
eukprot:scaffold41156_cov248-Skeletonema_marinoi.AAC.1